MPPYASLIDRVDALASALPPGEQADVRRVAEICRALTVRERKDERLRSAPEDAATGRELLRLIEILGRRSARALPAAALARAAFSDLKGDFLQTRMVSREVEEKLVMLGA